jgi:hypothetical protein
MPDLLFVINAMRSPETLDDGNLHDESVRSCLGKGKAMWMVWLEGNPEHLSLCCYFFEEGPQRICREGDGFVFCCDDFNDCKSSDDVLDRAKESLELTLGAIELASGENFDVAITGCLIKVDENGNRCYIMKTAAGTGEMEGSARFLYSGDCHVPSSYLLAAKKDKHLSLALQLWGGKQRSWARLYRIAEEIQGAFSTEGKRQHMSEIFERNKLCNCTEDSHCRCEDQVRIFRHCANEPEIAHADARHGTGFGKPTDQVSDSLRRCGRKMTHDEAVRFVKTALVRALQRKSEDSKPK